MFNDTHDIRIRAFVRSIKEDGTTKLAEYFIRNQQNGILYEHNKDYDNIENEEIILKLLRTGQK